MEILNIDALAAPKRQLTLKGVSHEVLDLSVQDFIDNMTAANKLEASKLGGAEEAMESMRLSMIMIKRSVPTLGDAEIARLNPNQVGVLLQFIRGELDKGIGALNQPASAGGEADEKKPS